MIQVLTLSMLMSSPGKPKKACRKECEDLAKRLDPVALNFKVLMQEGPRVEMAPVPLPAGRV